MVEMGRFSNEFVANLQIGLMVFVAMATPVFGYLYNRWIGKMDENEHTSLYVAIGVAITLLLGALISWKSSILMLVLFGLDGIFMIGGEFKRTEKKKKTPRRKRMPYAINGLLDEAAMSGEEAHRAIGIALKHEVTKEDLYLIDHELHTIIRKIAEIKGIQVNEK